MRLLILLIFISSSSYAHDASQAIVYEINRQLTSSGVNATCEVFQSGGYTSNGGIVTSAVRWEVQCRRMISIYWEPRDVRGSPTSTYEIVYGLDTGSMQTIQTEDNGIVLDIENIDEYTIWIRAVDELGNTEDIYDYHVE